MDNPLMVLAQNLLRLTRERKVQWEASGRASGRFIFSGPNASVVLETKLYRSERDRIRFVVLNAAGDEVDEVMVNLSPAMAKGLGSISKVVFNDADEELINSLYREVRRSVMRADEVITDLLKALPSEDEPGDGAEGDAEPS